MLNLKGLLARLARVRTGSARPGSRAPIRLSEFIHARMTGRDPHKPRIDKVVTARLIAENGLRGPKTYGVYDRIEDLDLDALPEVFVLKPTELNGKRGVMLLRRLPGGQGFWDGMQNRHLTAEQVVDEQRTWARLYFEKRARPLHFIAEELIVGENGEGQIPFDYKVYVFAGEPRFVVQSDRNMTPTGVAFFDGAFRVMPESDPRVTCGPKVQRTAPVVPACAQEILATASTLSRALATPFIRVDCYATPKGAVVGEITVAPGGPYTRTIYAFSETFDRELGRAWAEAAARLGQTLPVYDKSWSTEKRRTSGLPVKIG